MGSKESFTARELREWFSCDFATGEVFWKKSPHPRIPVGSIVGCKSSRGYMRTKVGGRHIAVHHIVWVLSHGEWPKQTLDHINRDKSDNRLCNLRDASLSLQQRNRTLPNRLGLRGVKRSRYGRYEAGITSDGKYKYLGTFSHKEDAAAAVQASLQPLMEMT